jgi:hypothetical protein
MDTSITAYLAKTERIFGMDSWKSIEQIRQGRVPPKVQKDINNFIKGQLIERIIACDEKNQPFEVWTEIRKKFAKDASFFKALSLG